MTEHNVVLNKASAHMSDLPTHTARERGRELVRLYNAISSNGESLKYSVLRQLFARCGENVRINQPLHVDMGCNISIGDNSFINMNCTLLDTGAITIGRDTLIGPDVKIYTATHPLATENRFYMDETTGRKTIKTLVQPVTIGDGVWIGGGAILLPGVIIGDNTVIGAGSVVTKSLPAGVVAFGYPCKVKRMVREGETTRCH